jgi:hypothetical protein
LAVRFNEEQLREVNSLFNRLIGDTDEILYRAINRTEDNAQVRAVDLIYQDLNLTKTRIRSDFTKRRAYRGRLRGTLKAEGFPVGLASFTGTRQLVSGLVSVKVKRTGTRHRLRHAWMAQARGSGPEHVWERVNYVGSGRRALWWLNPNSRFRYPLDRKKGPRVEDFYAAPQVYEPTERYASERLVVNTASQLDSFLARY